MKKRCIKNKKILRTVTILIFIQFFIICSFIRLTNESKIIDIDKTTQTDIYVEKTFYSSYFKGSIFVITANSTQYYFADRSVLSEYSNAQLNDVISVGDKISIIYYPRASPWGNNLILEAKNGQEVYRTINAFNSSKKGLNTIINFLFIFIEIVFLFIVFCYIYFYKKHFKQFFCKKKSRRGKTGDGSMSSPE